MANHAYSAIHSRPHKKNKASSHSSTIPTNPTAASGSRNCSTNDHLTQSHHPDGSAKIAQFLAHQLRQKSLPRLETPGQNHHGRSQAWNRSNSQCQSSHHSPSTPADLFPLEPPTGPQPSLIAMNLFEPVDDTEIDGDIEECDDDINDDDDADDVDVDDDVDEDDEYGSDLEEVGESGRVGCQWGRIEGGDPAIQPESLSFSFAPSQATIDSLCRSSSPQPMSPRALPIGPGPLLRHSHSSSTSSASSSSSSSSSASASTSNSPVDPMLAGLSLSINGSQESPILSKPMKQPSQNCPRPVDRCNRPTLQPSQTPSGLKAPVPTPLMSLRRPSLDRVAGHASACWDTPRRASEDRIRDRRPPPLRPPPPVPRPLNLKNSAETQTTSATTTTSTTTTSSSSSNSRNLQLRALRPIIINHLPLSLITDSSSPLRGTDFGSRTRTRALFPTTGSPSSASTNSPDQACRSTKHHSPSPLTPGSNPSLRLSSIDEPDNLITQPKLRSTSIRTPNLVRPPWCGPLISPSDSSFIMPSLNESEDSIDTRPRDLTASNIGDHKGLINPSDSTSALAFSLAPQPSINQSVISPVAPVSDRSLSLPITPEALLKHVRQMRIASKKRKLQGLSNLIPRENSSLTVHSRAGSNSSSNFEETLFNSSHSSADGQTQAQSENPTSGHQNLSIPDPRQEEMRAVAETLDLSHQRIADLTQPVVEELAEYVERLALGYNYLPVLPDHFALLGESLRYLNLRGNHMEIFPDVLTRMPSLEILDVSRNKIRAFPRRPGTLDRLRVLSVSRNRIRRLPNYVANLTTLRVLKIDHNPVAWPPRELITFADASEKADEDDQECMSRSRDETSTKSRNRTPSNDTSTAMAQWLRTLQEWMRKNPYARSVKQLRPATGETLVDSSDHVPQLHIELEKVQTSSKLANSPEDSPVLSFDYGNQSSYSTNQAQVSEIQPEPLLQHTRNASSSSSSQWVRKRPELRLKKSLPDLRRNHAEIMVERRADADRSYSVLNRSNHFLPPSSSSSTSATFLLSSPLIPERGLRSATPFTSGPKLYFSPAESSTPASDAVCFNDADPTPHARPQPRRMKIGNSGADDRLAGDRNSGAYFRRLSMLPASTISKEVSVPLLKLMDAIRGILFSLSQIYSALKQFVVFATQDRLPGALSRMMSIADDSMGRLINSLDRFDSSTRRSQPSIGVVEEVFKSCRENVVIFGKLVNVLSIQLKVLTSSADVRYSRTLLLSLYGATAEIAMSWSTITPLVDDVIRLSRGLCPPLISADPTHDSNKRPESPHGFQTPVSFLIKTNSSCDNTSESESTPELNTEGSGVLKISSINDAQRSGLHSPGPTPLALSRPKIRRHAGSFSVEDVQLGAILPPFSAGLMGSFPNGAPSTATPTASVSAPLPSPPIETNLSTIAGIDLNVLGTAALSDSVNSGSNQLVNRSGSARVNTLNTGMVPPLLTISERADCESEAHLPSSRPLSPVVNTSLSKSGDFAYTIPGGSTLVVEEVFNEQPQSAAENVLDLPNSSSSSRLIDPIQSRSLNFPNCGPFTLTSPRVGQSSDMAPAQRHVRMDSSLSRTDQDFLDMTEATVDIAVSVTSMMLEHLGQTFQEPATNHGDDRLHGSKSNQPERKTASPGLSRSLKANELKELCELEIEVIKRLRLSLANFWNSRAKRMHHSRENSGQSSDHESSRSTVSDEKEGSVQGPLARKVFEDATAFVRAVIQMANFTRATMTEFPLTKSIREGLGQLTKTTKELATLLAVSSFKPSPTHSTNSGSTLSSTPGSILSSSSPVLTTATNSPAIDSPNDMNHNNAKDIKGV